jgi:serine protease Do
VIANADEIQIMTRTHSERFLAKVVARDQVTDIAVLKVSLPVVIQPLFVGDSEKLEVGESVFAIGNPFGLGHTVTRGIVSAKDRSLGVGRIDRYLQTDASINPGNSGGPLFNFKGEVVGINTLSRVGAQGIGFAIPSNTIKKILPILERSGRLDRCWIGVAGVADSKGVLVTSLVKSSPAYELGLKEGDLLLSINVDGTPTEISSLWVLRDVLETSTPGQKIEFQVKRGEKLFLGKLELKTRPSDDRLPEGYDFF